MFFIDNLILKTVIAKLKAEKEFERGDAIFTSQERVLCGLDHGVKMVTLKAGELLYFPSAMHHEVHNMTPQSAAITNAMTNNFFISLMLPMDDDWAEDQLKGVVHIFKLALGHLEE